MALNELRRERGQSATALLNATAEILSEATNIEISLSEVAKRSGVNSAMIKYHFGNKEGLLVALLEREADREMVQLEHLVGMDWKADRKLKTHIFGIINAYYRSPYLNRLIHFLVSSGSPAASQRVTELFIQPIIKAYTKIVAQGVEEGKFRNVDPGMLYYAIIGAADHIYFAGYSIPTILGGDGLNDEIKNKYAEMIAEIFLMGLKPKS